MEVCNEQCFIARHRRASFCLPLGFYFAVVEGDGRGEVYQPFFPAYLRVLRQGEQDKMRHLRNSIRAS